MDDTDLNVLSILSTFSSNDNIKRREAETLFNDLYNRNPEKMVDCLITIIHENKNCFEAFSAIIKIGAIIESSSIRQDCNFSDDFLNKIRAEFLSILIDSSYPQVSRDYILSVLEDFIYITNASESDWPELVPFFLSLLNTDDWCLSLRFFTYFQLVNYSENSISKGNTKSDEFYALLQPHIHLDAANENERVASLKYILTLFNTESQVIESFDSIIPQIPIVLSSFGLENFSSSYHLFWKVFKKNEKKFSSIVIEIIGTLLRNASDPSNNELFRRDNLFFFHQLYNFSKKCRKAISQTFDITIKIISANLQFPNVMPDVYEEAREILFDICTEKLAEPYYNNQNQYVSSFFRFFSVPSILTSTSDLHEFIRVMFHYLRSDNSFIYENGYLCLKKCIDCLTELDDEIKSSNISREFGRKLFKLVQKQNWKKYIDLFSYWCNTAAAIDVEPYLKKFIDLVSSNSAYLLLHCASIMCCKCRENAKSVLKMTMKRLEMVDSINSFQLSILSNTFQCVNIPVSQESFKTILPLCVKSLALLNSISFLEIMEIIGYKFIPYLDVIIPALFKYSETPENTKEILDFFEKIISLFGNNIETFLDQILDYALKNGSNPSFEIRLESLTLINLLLQNNWENQTLYRRCLVFVMTQVPYETSVDCFASLLSIIILFIDRNDVSNEILESFLSYVPYIVAKAVEIENSKNSPEIFASAGSIFSILLKKIPKDTTKLFFELQKIIPHYSISKPGEQELRCFSLLTWTDFITLGPEEHTKQYIDIVLNDLKFYAESEANDDFRKIAIICLYSYYTTIEKTTYEIDTIFDEFYFIAKEQDRNSIDIVETSVSAFAILLQKYINEKNFIYRVNQLLSLLPLKRANDESDTVYMILFDFAIMCSRNDDLFDFFNPLKSIIQDAIKKHYVSERFTEDIMQKIIDQGDKIPASLQLILR